MVDQRRKELSDTGKGRPCEVRGEANCPVASEQRQEVYFISHLLSLLKSSAGVGGGRKKA